MPSSVYWDSCVWISLFERTAGRIDACEHLVEQATLGQIVIVTSALAIAEVCRIPGSSAPIEEQCRKIIEYFENDFIAVRSVDRPTAILANEFARLFGLMPADAIHAATAVINNVPEFHTYDASKGRRRGLLRHNGRIGNPPLLIREPPRPTPGPLFEAKGGR